MKEKTSEGVRLDKWLWAARFYKTRALAREMIEGGKALQRPAQQTRQSGRTAGRADAASGQR